MPKRGPKREKNIITTSHLEHRIAFYITQGDVEGERAIRWIAKEIGAPVTESVIQELVSKYREYDRGDEYWFS